MDAESDCWLSELRALGAQRDQAMGRLHELLLKVCFKESYRRGPSRRITGPELDDLAHQAANDAMVSVLAKLDLFRGESRFTTWVYKFGVLEVANKVSRHHANKLDIGLDAEEWDRLPGNFGDEPLAQAQHHDLIAAVRRGVDESLTENQRRCFVAAVVNGVPMDTLAAQTGKKLGAIYKAIFDARRQLRRYLTDNGYLDQTNHTAASGAQNAGEQQT